ncbi:hypothetical protein EKJ_16660 [Qipengyuania flava]|uniref:Uncharacterized protein n=1 Tax=Qipengyuania flava TaxID=192812 RepID=A0A3T1CIK1_9SPHN|nr:hypothetical protein [Qipengyuania flava]BBI20819.1 hypothetical protein EKJ_16660 [Qipengyuania flava]
MSWGKSLAQQGLREMNGNAPRRREDDVGGKFSGAVAERLSSEICNQVLELVRKGEANGARVTLADLSQLTGLPFRLSFAVARALESQRRLVIRDNPCDPLGGTLSLREREGSDFPKSRVA